ncbi:MAG: hypothetical protein EON60_00430 [Alphaproteobacteria bacterium]|nr:MAG: hypothetical protein EON60_00430 [Alphaproteobacteria bacterium]
MPVSITANLSARYAQSSLVKQNDAVNASTARMSSGNRVLSAADDASAMAIGTSLKIENSGLRSAILNATSATSMLQIADGALGQISELLSRMNVLAVQSSSGQYDDAARALLNGEFQGLKGEVDRIARVTSFNGVDILAGTPQFDLEGGSSIAADGIRNIRLDTSVLTADSSFRYTYDEATEVMTVTKIDGGVATPQSINLTPLLNGSVGVGIDLSGSQTLELSFSQLGLTLVLGAGFQRNVDIANPVAVTGVTVTATTPTFTPATTNVPNTLVDDLTALGGVYDTATGALNLPLTTSGAGGTVTLDGVPGLSFAVNGGAVGASGAASGDLVGAGTTVDVYADLADGSGQVLLGRVTMATVAATGAGAGTMQIDAGGGILTATGTGEVGARHLTYKVGTGVLAGEDTLGVDVPAMTVQALGLEGLDILTQIDANGAISALTSAMTVLNQGRALIGAQQLRLEAVGRNLGVISDNNEAARSAMMDVDVGVEISTLTANQTLMQASIAMLSRANQMPDMLLELLRN